MSRPCPARSELSAALTDLKPLIGRWTVRVCWSKQTHIRVGGPRCVEGTASFAASADGAFLAHTMSVNGVPTSQWRIGRDDTSGAYVALYADDRGVSRIYQMSVNDGVWKLWRDAPGFHQRFTARLGHECRLIEACWEKSLDGSTWDTDFDLQYTNAL